jgi:hypothetical protein
MATENPPYAQWYITTWTILSIVVALGLLAMFFFGHHFLTAGHIVWSLIRWIFSPII